MWEYTRVQRDCVIDIPDEEIRKIAEEYRQKEYSLEDFREAVRDFCYDHRWDYIQDSDIYDEETDDTEMQDNFHDALDDIETDYEHWFQYDEDSIELGEILVD
jgi:hypothetical protein